MLRREDRPVVYALLAVAFALFLNVGISFAQQPNSGSQNQVTANGPAESAPEIREAIATEVIADYTRKLAVLTGVLAAVGLITSGLTLWQILLTRTELNATHRPVLYVRNLSLVDSLNQGPIKFGGPIAARFIVANKGGTAATIIGGYLEICWSSSGVPPDRIYEVGIPATSITRIISAGGYEIVDAESGIISWPVGGRGTVEDVTHGGQTIFGRIRTRAYFPHAHPRPPLYVFGWIQFRGESGTTYQMGFCREWDEIRRVFRRVDDPDFEYEA